MVSYYKDGAKEYEKIYSKPERQKGLILIKEFYQSKMLITGKVLKGKVLHLNGRTFSIKQVTLTVA
jgi:hypothetical protein